MTDAYKIAERVLAHDCDDPSADVEPLARELLRLRDSFRDGTTVEVCPGGPVAVAELPDPPPFRFCPWCGVNLDALRADGKTGHLCVGVDPAGPDAERVEFITYPVKLSPELEAILTAGKTVENVAAGSLGQEIVAAIERAGAREQPLEVAAAVDRRLLHLPESWSDIVRFADRCFYVASAPMSEERKLREVDLLIEQFLAIRGNLVGGQLHIVLDDSNWEDAAIRACLASADDAKDLAAAALAALLLSMSYPQRMKLAAVCGCGCTPDKEP